MHSDFGSPPVHTVSTLLCMYCYPVLLVSAADRILVFLQSHLKVSPHHSNIDAVAVRTGYPVHYTFCSSDIFDLTLISSCLRVLCDLNTGLTPRGAHTLPIFSLTPFMYGRSSSFFSLLFSLLPRMSPVPFSCSRIGSGCIW